MPRRCRSRRGFAITEVHKRVEGDARFPAIDPRCGAKASRSEQQPAADDEASFAFVGYERVNAAAKRPPTAS